MVASFFKQQCKSNAMLINESVIATLEKLSKLWIWIQNDFLRVIVYQKYPIVDRMNAFFDEKSRRFALITSQMVELNDVVVFCAYTQIKHPFSYNVFCCWHWTQIKPSGILMKTTRRQRQQKQNKCPSNSSHPQSTMFLKTMIESSCVIHIRIHEN